MKGDGKSAISFFKKGSKGLTKGSGFVNHLYSKYSKCTVVKREANFTTRHVKGLPFVERRNT